MVSQGAYSIAASDQEIVVRLRAGGLDRESLVKFLDFLELESIRRRSQLTPDQAASLAREIDESAWQSVRGSLEQKSLEQKSLEQKNPEQK